MDGWMVDSRFSGLFNSISVISRQWVCDNEWLCAMETCFVIEKIAASSGS